MAEDKFEGESSWISPLVLTLSQHLPSFHRTLLGFQMPRRTLFCPQSLGNKHATLELSPSLNPLAISQTLSLSLSLSGYLFLFHLSYLTLVLYHAVISFRVSFKFFHSIFLSLKLYLSIKLSVSLSLFSQVNFKIAKKSRLTWISNKWSPQGKRHGIVRVIILEDQQTERLFIQTDDLEGENSSETNPRVNIFILFVKT